MYVNLFFKYFVSCVSFYCFLTAHVHATESPKLGNGEVVVNGLRYFIGNTPNWVTKVNPVLNSSKAESSMHYVLVDKQIKVKEDTVNEFSHIVRSINSAAGLVSGSQIEIVFDPSFETLVFHKLSLVRDGVHVNKLTKNTIQLLQRETQLEAQIYNGLVSASILLDDIRIGDKIEYAYTIQGANPVFKKRFSYIDWAPSINGDVDFYQLRLLTPKTKALNLELGPKFKKSEKLLSDGQIEIQVVREKIPQFNYDPTAPLSTYIDEQIIVSEYGSWGDVAKWAAGLFELKTSESLKRKAVEIKESSKDRDEQLLNALKYVQTEIRYMGMEIGPNTHLPNSPDMVMKQRFGDCKDKALLFLSLLDELGIKAKPVLVSTDYKYGLSEIGIPTPLVFNHVIVKVELDGNDFWFDLTRNYQTGALRSRNVTGLGEGLVVDKTSQKLEKLPDSFDSKHIVVKEHFIASQFNEDPDMLSEVTYFGDYAEAARSNIATLSKDKLDTVSSEVYLKSYPKIRKEGSVEIIDSESENAITLKQKFKMVDFWTYPEAKFLLGQMVYWNPVMSMERPNEVNRKIPFSIQMPGIYTHEIIFDYPEDSVKPGEKIDFSENNDVFSYKVKHTSTERQTRFFAQLKHYKNQVSVAEWPAFVESTLKLRDASGALMAIPLIPNSKIEELKKEIFLLNAEFENKTITQVQKQAHFQILFLKAQLEYNRLSKKFKAVALDKLATSEDTVGEFENAKKHFNEAILLSADDSNLYADAAVNAFMLREDDLAIKHVRKSLELSPSDNSVLRTLAHAHYFKGDYEKAKSTLMELLEKDDPSRKGYTRIWLYLSMLRNGDQAESLIKTYLSEENDNNWPDSMIKALIDDDEYEEVLTKANQSDENKQKLCELYYYLGEKFLTSGDNDKAKEFFSKSVDTGIIEYSEYNLSERRLDMLSKL